MIIFLNNTPYRLDLIVFICISAGSMHIVFIKANKKHIDFAIKCFYPFKMHIMSKFS